MTAPDVPGLGEAVARLTTHADWLRDGPDGSPPYSMVDRDYQDDLRAVLDAIRAAEKRGEQRGARDERAAVVALGERRLSLLAHTPGKIAVRDVFRAIEAGEHRPDAT